MWAQAQMASDAQAAAGLQRVEKRLLELGPEMNPEEQAEADEERASLLMEEFKRQMEVMEQSAKNFDNRHGIQREPDD